MILQTIKFQCDCVDCAEVREHTEALATVRLEVYYPTLPDGWAEIIGPDGIKQYCEWHQVNVSGKARSGDNG